MSTSQWAIEIIQTHQMTGIGSTRERHQVTCNHQCKEEGPVHYPQRSRYMPTHARINQEDPYGLSFMDESVNTYTPGLNSALVAATSRVFSL